MTSPSTAGSSHADASLSRIHQISEVAAVNALDDLTLPSAKLELGGNRVLSELIKQFGVIERAPVEQIELLEELVDRHYAPAGFASFIFTGRTAFELVSPEEAALFRAERRADREQLDAQIKNAPPMSPLIDPEKSVVFGGLSNLPLFDGITRALGISRGDILFSNFANGETRVVVNESVRQKDVFVLQTLSPPVNEHLAELLFEIDALKRASAQSINVVIPYFGYERQDRKDGRSPISAALVARLLKKSGAHRLMVLDLHSEQIEGFFNGPFDNLFAHPLMMKYIGEKYGDKKLLFVSPDAGGMKRVERIVKDAEGYYASIGMPIQIEQAGMTKRRDQPNQVAEMLYIGDKASIKGKTCFLFDDMIDTGGTNLLGARILRDNGAAQVIVSSTHGIFSSRAIEKFRSASYRDSSGQERRLIDEVIVSDTLPLTRARGDLIKVISTKNLLAEAIRRVAEGRGGSLRDLSGFRGHD